MSRNTRNGPHRSSAPATESDRDGPFDFDVTAGRGGRFSRIGPLLQRAALQLSRPLGSVAGPRLDMALGILVYHRVVSIDARLPEPTYNVPPQQFRSQLARLLARGYQPWPLSRVLDHHRRGEHIPRKTFVVTFDDGYANNYSQAWPVLRELGVPATIFVATAYLDSDRPFPFDSWSGAGRHMVAEAWQPLSSQQCAQMLAGGLIELGAHTHTHADFRGRPDALRADLQQCVETLRSRFGVEDVTFAFPQGRKAPGFVSPQLVSAARAAGVVCALTTENDLVLPGSDPFDWGRFTVDRHDTAVTLAARLDGWYALLRDVSRKLRALGTKCVSEN